MIMRLVRDVDQKSTLLVHHFSHAVEENSNVCTRHVTLISIGNQHSNHQDNTILPWTLSCTCSITHCECLAKLRLDIVYIQGVACEQNGPLIPTPNLTIQIIIFTFTHGRFLDQSHTNKRRQMQPISRCNESTRLEYRTPHSYHRMSKGSHSHKKQRTPWEPAYPHKSKIKTHTHTQNENHPPNSLQISYIPSS